MITDYLQKHGDREDDGLHTISKHYHITAAFNLPLQHFYSISMKSIKLFAHYKSAVFFSHQINLVSLNISTKFYSSRFSQNGQ